MGWRPGTLKKYLAPTIAVPPRRRLRASTSTLNDPHYRITLWPPHLTLGSVIVVVIFPLPVVLPRLLFPQPQLRQQLVRRNPRVEIVHRPPHRKSRQRARLRGESRCIDRVITQPPPAANKRVASAWRRIGSSRQQRTVCGSSTSSNLNLCVCRFARMLRVSTCGKCRRKRISEGRRWERESEARDA